MHRLTLKNIMTLKSRLGSLKVTWNDTNQWAWWVNTTLALSAGTQRQSTLLAGTTATLSTNRWDSDLNWSMRWHYFGKLALFWKTCTPDPIRSTRLGPDPNRPMRWAIFFKNGRQGPCQPDDRANRADVVFSHSANQIVHIWFSTRVLW